MLVNITCNCGMVPHRIVIDYNILSNLYHSHITSYLSACQAENTGDSVFLNFWGVIAQNPIPPTARILLYLSSVQQDLNLLTNYDSTSISESLKGIKHDFLTLIKRRPFPL